MSDNMSSGTEGAEYYKEKSGAERVIGRQHRTWVSIYRYLASYVYGPEFFADRKNTILIDRESAHSDREALSAQHLLSEKKCHVLIFEVCYSILRTLSAIDLDRMGEAVLVFLLFLYRVFGAQKPSDGLENYYAFHMAKYLTAHFYQKRVGAFG